MPAGTLADARAIARDVARTLDAFVAQLDRRADAALADQRRDQAIALRTRVEELARAVQRLRDI